MILVNNRSHQGLGANIMIVCTGETFQINQIIKIKDIVPFTNINRAKIYALINEKS